MEGYFETIGGRGDGIVGSAAGFFWFFSLVCPKEFFLNFFLPFFKLLFSFCSVSLDFLSFLLICMVWAPENSGGGISWWHHPCYPTRCKSG